MVLLGGSVLWKDEMALRLRNWPLDEASGRASCFRRGCILSSTVGWRIRQQSTRNLVE